MPAENTDSRPVETPDETPAETPRATGAEAEAPPRPKIDLADVLTVVGRSGSALLLSMLAVFLFISHQWLAGSFVTIVSLLVQGAAIKTIYKMRAENPEYIAWRASVEEAQRREREEQKRRQAEGRS